MVLIKPFFQDGSLARGGWVGGGRQHPSSASQHPIPFPVNLRNLEFGLEDLRTPTLGNNHSCFFPDPQSTWGGQSLYPSPKGHHDNGLSW